MFKTKTIGGTLHNHFADQVRPVSIATDTFDFSDTTEYKVFFQLEPPDIVPTEQPLLDGHTFYDLILAWNERTLVGCPNNAHKFIFGTCRWAEDPADDCDVSKKRFAASYLTSSKTMCKGHHFRHDIFNVLSEQVGQVPIAKHMSPPYVDDKKSFLYPFQYAIVMENGRRTNWITEKLIDSLVSRTVPIYWGCPNVGEYFNTNSILSFETQDELMAILGSLSSSFYASKLDSIDENLHEAMKYTNLHKRIDEEIRKRL